jgi:hypothetical protein
MSNETAPPPLPFGLLELDASGTVIYFRPDGREVQTPAGAYLIGRNFFADVPVVAEAEELQDRLDSFRRNHAPADSFTCTFSSEQGHVRAKVLLAQSRTYSVEGDAAESRRYPARLTGRSRCFSKRIEALRRAVGLSVRRWDWRQMGKRQRPRHPAHPTDAVSSLT